MAIQIETTTAGLTSIEKDPITARESLRRCLQNQNIGITELDKLSGAAFLEVRGENPEATPVTLYKLFAKELPFFIKNKYQEDAMRAAENPDIKIAQAGSRVFTLINMRKIVSAAEPFLSGDPDQDSDLIQAGIVYLIDKLQKRPEKNRGASINIYTYVHGTIQYGIAQEIARKEGVRTDWVRNRSNIKIAKIVDNAFAQRAFGIPIADTMGLADKIAEITGEPASTIEKYINFRNYFVPETPEAFEEETLVIRLLKDKLPEAFRRISPNQALVLEARYELPPYEHKYILAEAGGLIQKSAEWARKLEALGLLNLRNVLQDYDYRDKSKNAPSTLKIPKPVRPDKNEDRPVDFSNLLGIPVNENRMVYRYPFTGIGEMLDWDTAKALIIANVDSVAQLLQESEEELLTIEGIGEKQITIIKKAMRHFLEEDAQILTLGEKLGDR